MSFKDKSYSITQGITATGGSVFHIAPYSEKMYSIEYVAQNQLANNIYSESSFIAIGFWR